MDRETLKKMKEAQKRADEAMNNQKLASDHNNKEFWEKNLKILQENRKAFLNNLAETDFLISAYEEKIKTFKQ